MLYPCNQGCGVDAGPSEAGIFNMAGALVMSRALKVFHSAKNVVMEVVRALISVKYCRFSSNGSSCNISRFVPIMVLYPSAWLIS